jgi:hypothetical protein
MVAAKRQLDFGCLTGLHGVSIIRAVAVRAVANQKRKPLAGGGGDRIIPPFELGDTQLGILSGNETNWLIEFEFQAPNRRR